MGNLPRILAAFPTPVTDDGLARTRHQHWFIRLTLSAFLAAIPLGLCHTVFVPSYRFHEAGDDAVMEMLAQGVGITSTPTPHLLFINIIPGRALVWLYTHSPGFPWYRVAMQGIHLAATLTIIFLFLGRRLTLARLLVLVSYLLSFDLYAYVRPQFTITAASACQAAVMIWMVGIQSGTNATWPRLTLFATWVVFAALVRYESVVLAFLVVAPLIAWVSVGAWTSPAGQAVGPAFPRGRRFAGRVAIPLALASAALLIPKWYNERVYEETPGWEHFYRFNWLRAQITDWQQAPYVPATQPVFTAVGWSGNDYQLLRTWFFPDPQVYSIEKFERILTGVPQALADARARDVAPSVAPAQGHPTILDQFQALSQFQIEQLLCAALLLQFIFLHKIRGVILQVALVAGAIMVLSCFFAGYLHRLPVRITDSMLSILSIVMLSLPMEESFTDWIDRRPRACVRIAVVALFLVQSVDAAVEARLLSRGYVGEHQIALEMIDAMRARRDELYVIQNWPGFLYLTADDMAARPNVQLLCPWYLLQTPVSTARLREFGHKDFWSALRESNRVFVVAEYGFCIRLIAYLKEHFAISRVPEWRSVVVRDSRWPALRKKWGDPGVCRLVPPAAKGSREKKAARPNP